MSARICPRCGIVPRPKSGGMCPHCVIDARSGATMRARGVPANQVAVRRKGIVRWIDPEVTEAERQRRARQAARKAATMAAPRVPLAAVVDEATRAAEARAQEAADQIWARINERRANVASFERWSA